MTMNRRLSTVGAWRFGFLVWVSSLSLVSVASAEEFYRIQNLFGNDKMYIENEYGHRFLQRSSVDVGPRADLNMTSNTCATTAFNIICNVKAALDASDGSGGDMDLTIKCALDSQTAFDFRRATSCECGIALKNPDGSDKKCGCSVCPDSFGDSPVSIQCTDDYAVGTCTSLDCGFGCNGTCNFGCEVPAGCPFCENNELAPTVSPTGAGGQGSPVRGPTIDSAATKSNSCLMLGIMTTVIASTSYMLAF